MTPSRALLVVAAVSLPTLARAGTEDSLTGVDRFRALMHGAPAAQSAPETRLHFFSPSRAPTRPLASIVLPVDRWRSASQAATGKPRGMMGLLLRRERLDPELANFRAPPKKSPILMARSAAKPVARPSLPSAPKSFGQTVRRPQRIFKPSNRPSSVNRMAGKQASAAQTRQRPNAPPNRPVKSPVKSRR